MNETRINEVDRPVFQINSRDFAARTGTFGLGRFSLSVPAVLFAAGTHDEYGKEFETLLTSSRIETEKVQFMSSRNTMFHGERVSEIGERHVLMPNVIPFSSSLSGVAEAAKQKRVERVFVSTASPEEMDGVLDRDSDIYVMANAAELVNFPDQLAGAIIAMREKIGWRKLIYVPGVARPSNLALLMYAGVDIADSLLTEMDAARGRVTVDGDVREAGALGEGICHCVACANGMERVVHWHNRYQLLDELNRVRSAIRRGHIREMVERRAVQHSWNVQFLRYLDTEHHDYFERVCTNAGGSIIATSETSLRRADILRYVRRIAAQYVPPAGMKIALLVPCSRRKPYFRSKSHRIFRDAVMSSQSATAVHMLTVTSPIGIVPEELETVYPAAHYDIPVTGQWSADEKARAADMLLEILGKGGYEAVVSHLEDERDFVNAALRGAGIEFTDTSEGRTREHASVERLKSVLAAVKISGVPGWRERNRQFLESMARYQFGPYGTRLLEGVTVLGRYPNVRIILNGVQLGMLTEDRGLISLTLKGAERIYEGIPEYCVEIQNFVLRSNLFAAGVKRAGSCIRTGDEVVVTQNDRVAGVGVAMMPGDEMNERGKGEAVRIRHYSSHDAGKR